MKFGNNHRWMAAELRKLAIPFDPEIEPIITLRMPTGKTFKLWVPGHAEYIITEEMVTEAASFGTDIISYSAAWGKATRQAEIRARELGISLQPHAKTFNFFAK